MSGIPENHELGLSDNATPEQRKKRIAELDGFRGLSYGSTSPHERPGHATPDPQPGKAALAALRGDDGLPHGDQ